MRKYQRVKREQENARDKDRHEARAFHWYYDDDGMLVFHGRLPAEEGAAVLKALEAVADELFREESSRARQAAEAATAQEWDESTDVSAETRRRR